MRLSLPCLAEPPAESPSTRNNSQNAGSFSEQSASLPGRLPPSMAFFLLISSLAFLAASRALAAFSALSTIFRATEGFSSKNVPRCSLTTVSTSPFISLLPSLVLVCPSNCGFGSLMLTTAVSPSLISSPVNVSPFSILFADA